MSGEKMFKAVGYVDDKYLDIADSFQKEAKEMKTYHSGKRRSLMGLAAASICISLLAVTAVATGWIPGIFRELQEKYPEDQALFEAAAQANTEIIPEIVEIPQLDLSKIVLLERYYDGETILMGYNLDVVIPEPTVGFQPDKELMRRIKKGVPLSNVGWDKPKDWMGQSVTENAKKYHLGEDAFVMDQMMKGTLSDGAYKKAWKILEEQGWVCLATQNVYIGDHILVNGQEYYDPNTNPDALRAEYETEYGSCLRLEKLPQEARNQHSVTVTLPVRTSVQYWYMDLEGNGWILYDGAETELISFTLEREDGE